MISCTITVQKSRGGRVLNTNNKYTAFTISLQKSPPPPPNKRSDIQNHRIKRKNVPFFPGFERKTGANENPNKSQTKMNKHKGGKPWAYGIFSRGFGLSLIRTHQRRSGIKLRSIIYPLCIHSLHTVLTNLDTHQLSPFLHLHLRITDRSRRRSQLT